MVPVFISASGCVQKIMRYLCHMAKRPKKPKKRINQFSPDEPIPAELALSDDYQAYVKAHNARLRELERLAAGRNTYEPS